MKSSRVRLPKKKRLRLLEADPPKHRKKRVRLKVDDYDSYCQAIVSKYPNMMIPWYLMASYTYYERGSNLLTDGYYDRLAKDIAKQWKSLEHMHKHLLNRKDLQVSSSGFNIKYTNIIIGAAERLLRNKRSV